MMVRVLRDHRERADGGFTIIEVVTAIGLSAVIFAALASVLVVGLRTLSIQKSRTQANEIATQGIEDLQRLDFDHLGVCATASSPPSDLATPAYLSNCTATSTVTPPYSTPPYEEPCTPLTGSAYNIPMPSYTCTRINIPFTVRRYIAWGDSAQTKKRMAVFVDWIDAVGRHEVSEQSSVRSPSAASIIGTPPPALSAVGVTTVPAPATSTVIIPVNPSGTPLQPLIFSATTNGLVATDTVFVDFTFLSSGSPPSPTPGEVQLSSTDGVTWTGQIAASSTAYSFGNGSQYFAFTARRASDGKASGAFATPPVQFTCPSCGGTPPPPPQFVGSFQVPSSVSIDVAGVLFNPFTVTATTNYVTTSDRVSVSFQTLGGTKTQFLSPVSGGTCVPAAPPPSGNIACTWTATISPSSGYRFPQGPQPFFFAAEQVVATGTSYDVGSTTAGQSSSVQFG